MSAESVRCRIIALWGDPLEGPAGVVHVTAVGRVADRGLAVIRICPEAPTSETDAFSLAVARARADAIVTTGSILRAEAAVSHDPGPELRAWRRESLGKDASPTLAILTRGGIPPGHPALAGARVLVGTTRTSAAELGPAIASETTEVVGLADSSLRGLIDELVRRGHRDICVEAGPSTSAGLYDAPLAVDELMLSIFEETPLQDTLVAGRFPDEATLRARFGPATSEMAWLEESGRWRFRRFTRHGRPDGRAARGSRGRPPYTE